jgi:hypothetical protein
MEKINVSVHQSFEPDSASADIRKIERNRGVVKLLIKRGGESFEPVGIRKRHAPGNPRIFGELPKSHPVYPGYNRSLMAPGLKGNLARILQHLQSGLNRAAPTPRLTHRSLYSEGVRMLKLNQRLATAIAASPVLLKNFDCVISYLAFHT